MSLDQIHLLPPAQQEAILNGPALAPPPGFIPNLDDPPNSNVMAITIDSFLLSMATIAVLLAAYSKIFFIKRFYLEDFIALAGYGVYIGKEYTVLGLTTSVGIFVHQWDIRVRDLSTFLWFLHIGSEFYAVSLLLFKTAILLEWMRIFIPRRTRNNFFWACHALLWTNVVFYVTILIVGNVSCRPYAKLWDKTLPGTCRDDDTLDVATAFAGFVSDILILILPHPIIWRLPISKRKKIGIALMFAIGVSACVSSAYRIYASMHYLQSADKVYGVGGVALSGDAEMVCAILVFCVPIFPKAFKDTKSPFRIVPSLFSRLGKSIITGLRKDAQEKSPLSTESLLPRSTQRNDYPVPPTSHRQFESNVSYPHHVYFPDRAIPRTTQINVDEESCPGIPISTLNTFFYDARHYAQLNSSGSLNTYNNLNHVDSREKARVFYVNAI